MSWSTGSVVRAAFALLQVSCRGPTPAPGEPAVRGGPAAQRHEGPRDVELLASELRVSFDAAQRKSSTWRATKRIATQRGLERSSEIGMSWAPWHEERPELRAWVTAPGGERTPLDPATLSEAPARPDPNTFSDGRVLRAPLPGLVVGATFEEEIVSKEREPYFDGPRSFSWWPTPAPCACTQRFVVEAPLSLTLEHHVRGATLAATVEVIGERRRWTFEVSGGVAVGVPEPNAPGSSHPFVGVVFTTQPSWAAVAAAYHRKVAAARAPDEVAALVRGVGADERDLRVRVAKVLAHLRARVRYEAVLLGEAAIVPRRPREVLARGYGDCKDLSVLLVSALESLGIDASVALVSAGGAIDLDPDAPGLEAFDHAIVYVPDADLWVDATDDTARPGGLPTSVQGRRALIAEPDTRGLRTTWAATSADNTFREVREVSLVEGGVSRVLEVGRATGVLDTYMATSELASSEGLELRRLAGEYALTTYGTSTIARVSVSPRSAPYLFELETEAPRVADVSDDEGWVLLEPGFVVGWMPRWMLDAQADAQRGPRRGPMELRAPYRAELEYRIRVPSGFELREPPPPLDVAMGPARLTREVAWEGEVLVVKHRFDSGPRTYSAAEVEAFRAQAGRVDELSVRLQFEERSERHAAAGEHTQALAAARAAIEHAPRSAAAHSRYARRLIQAGLGDAARAAARRAVELEPKSAYAQFWLGWVLAHDRWGGEGRGADRAGARAAYERSIALEDVLSGPHANLGLLFEHNDRGLRWGSGARVDRAIEEHRIAVERFEVTDRRSLLVEALFQAGRHVEARAELAKGGRTAELAALALANAGVLDGAPAMRALAAAWPLRDEARAEAFRAAAFLLLGARKYPLAAEAMGEAAVGSTEEVARRASSSVLRRVRTIESVLASLAPPARAAVGYSTAISAWIVGEPLDPRWVSRALGEALRADDPAKFVALRRQIEASGVPHTAAIDIYASLAETRVESHGSDHRVLMRANNQDQTVLLVTEGGEPKVRANDPINASHEAWARLDRADQDGARRWTSWAVAMLRGGKSPVPLCAELASASPVVVRGCLASIIALNPEGRDAVGALTAARAQVPADRVDDYDELRLAAMVRAGRGADAEALARSLRERRPASRFVRAQLAAAWLLTGEGPAADKAIDGWLAEDPEDLLLSLVAMERRAVRGDFAGASDIAERLSGPTSHNNRAWARVCAGRAADAELDATQAAQATKFTNAAVLHTLATAQAELGKPEAAMATLRAAVDLEGEDELHHDFVAGRIAEGYGLRDEARAAYQRVLEKPRPTKPDQNDACMRHLAGRGLARVK